LPGNTLSLDDGNTFLLSLISCENAAVDVVDERREDASELRQRSDVIP
jgi:hypothetical protein